MILKSSVMMNIIYTQESQKIQHLSHLALLSLPKTFLQSQIQNLILILQTPLKHNNLSNFQHIVQNSFHLMTHHYLYDYFQGFSYQTTTL